MIHRFQALLPLRRPGAYARAALQAEFELVRRAAPGTRNTTLFYAARRLGQLVGAELLDEQLVTTRLTEAITAHLGVDGFTAGEAGTAINNGLRYGYRQPRRSPQPVLSADESGAGRGD